MLRQLYISNFVLIKELHFKPAEGLSIITGETGAGKSILLDALGLIRGNRADQNAVQDQSSKCIVEGEFDVSKLDLKEFFDEHELDYEPICILRREIRPGGRSRAFVNDTPVGLPIMRELSSKLIDVHSQHQTSQMASEAYLLDWLDAISGSERERLAYRQDYDLLTSLKRRLEKLKDESGRLQTERDFNQFLFDELDKAGLAKGEMKELNEKQFSLQHIEEISSQILGLYQYTKESDEAAVDRLNQYLKSLSDFGDHNDRMSSLTTRLQSVIIELEDTVNELYDLNAQLEDDPAALEMINDRLTVLHALMQKHHVQDADQLIEKRDELDNKLYAVDSLDNEISELETQISQLEAKCLEEAETISALRNRIVPELTEQINLDLRKLGLPDAEVNLILSKNEKLNYFGNDSFKLQFRANKGGRIEEVHKVASGGESSRLMLILKSYLARYKHLPSIIFDEIDTGVSGEVAFKVGEVMRELGKELQVLTITHLPQIAAMGRKHYFVYKSVEEEFTHTFLRELDQKDRVLEIAKMIGGEDPSEASIRSAEELVGSLSI